MANLLFANPNDWWDNGQSSGPPAAWNGTGWTFPASDYAGFPITYNGTINAGDTLDALVSWDAIPAGGAGGGANVVDFSIIGGAPAPSIDFPDPPQAAGSQSISWTAQGGESGLSITGAGIVSNGESGPSYFGVTIAQQSTPTPVAPDENLTVPSWTVAPATNVTVIPAITSGGQPVSGPGCVINTNATNGTATVEVSGGAYQELSYTPNKGFVGNDSFTYKAYDYQTSQWSNVATVTVTVTQAAPQCEEIGNVTRAKVSAYQRARVHHSRLVRGEVRCLIADFNGAIPADRTITSVIWRCEQPYYVAMSNANIQTGSRATGVTITAQLQGFAWLKCEATLDNGELYTQVFTVSIMATPYFYGEIVPTLGPYILTAP